MNSLFALAIVHFFFVASPGPNVFLVVKYSIDAKTRKNDALLCALGITLGIIQHLIFMYVGVSFLITHTPIAYKVVCFLGAFWLFYIAYSMIFVPGTASCGKRIADTKWSSPLVQGYFNNLLNPKCFVYFTSVVAPFMGRYGQNFSYIFIVLVAVSLLWFLSLALFLKLPIMQKNILTYGRYIEKACGCVLILLAIFILTELIFW